MMILSFNPYISLYYFNKAHFGRITQIKRKRSLSTAGKIKFGKKKPNIFGDWFLMIFLAKFPIQIHEFIWLIYFFLSIMPLNSKVILAILLGLVLVNSSIISTEKDERKSENSEQESEKNSENSEPSKSPSLSRGNPNANEKAADPLEKGKGKKGEKRGLKLTFNEFKS